MNNDKVTVVTVTYNAKDFLEETILSVINQSYDNIEYIIIDGGSTDGTVDIIKKYEDQIAYWVSEPDEGIYFAMNKAIEKATGEWINFMNAGDTFVDNATVQKVIGRLNKETELIYGNHIFDGTICSVKGRKISRLIPCCHQSLFVKTILMKQSPYNTLYKISADYEFILKMYQKDKKIQYIEEPIAEYQGSGFSENNKLRWYLEVLTLMMNNGVDLDDIVNSPAFKLLINLYQKSILTIKENNSYIIFEVEQKSENTQIAFYLFKDYTRIDVQWYSKNYSYRLDKKNYGKGDYRIQYFIVDNNVENLGNAEKKEIGYSEFIKI